MTTTPSDNAEPIKKQEKIICHKCGQEIESSKRFCTNCGTIIKKSSKINAQKKDIQKEIEDIKTEVLNFSNSTSNNESEEKKDRNEV